MDQEPIKFHIDYVVGGEAWRVECEMITRLGDFNFPSCKMLDLISVVSATNENGEMVPAALLKELMLEHETLAEFWVDLIDHVAHLTMSIMSATPGEA